MTLHSEGLWSLLRLLSARPEGFSTEEVVARSEFSRHQVGRACGTLREKRHELVVLRISHKNARYFATQAQADAYMARVKTKRPGNATFKPKHGVAANWAPGTEAVIPPGVEVQRGPCHPPRNTVHEFPFLHTRRGL